jgi:hypothetical protein
VSIRVVKRLSRDEIVENIGILLQPEKGRGFTEEQKNVLLFEASLNCPDPYAALGIFVETCGPVTAEELVDRALDCPPRNIATVSASELPLVNPLRHWILETR